MAVSPPAAAPDPLADRLPRASSRTSPSAGGDPSAVSSDGQYRGKYQFDRQTWQGLGGSGDPAQASETEQDRLAQQLLDQSGTDPWAGCL